VAGHFLDLNAFAGVVVGDGFEEAEGVFVDFLGQCLHALGELFFKLLD
jgi:hypothetical protein